MNPTKDSVIDTLDQFNNRPWQDETNRDFLLNLLSNLQTCQPYKSFPENRDGSEIRRAAVAVILRLNFEEYSRSNLSPESSEFESSHRASIEAKGFLGTAKDEAKDPKWRLSRLLDDARRRHPILEVLFIERSTRPGDKFSGHIAFPGGKQDLGVIESDLDIAIRECQEELGLDLRSTEDFCYLGQLDDRSVKSWFGFTDILVLSPQLFLQVGPDTPTLKIEVSEVSNVGWVPISHLTKYVNSQPLSRTSLPDPKKDEKAKRWISKDLADRVFPSSESCNPLTSLAKQTFRKLFGGMHFTAIPLPQPLAPAMLWGVTLGVVSDLVDMGYTHRQVGRMLPLEFPLPEVDLWPINPLIRRLCPHDPLRKPTTCRHSSPWDGYFRALHTVGSATLFIRTLLILILGKYLNQRRHLLVSTFLWLFNRFNPSNLQTLKTLRQ